MKYPSQLLSVQDALWLFGKHFREFRYGSDKLLGRSHRKTLYVRHF